MTKSSRPSRSRSRREPVGALARSDPLLSLPLALVLASLLAHSLASLLAHSPQTHRAPGPLAGAFPPPDVASAVHRTAA